MAPTTLLSIGYPQLMSQGVVYALPTARVIRITCDDATATFNVDNDSSFPHPQTPTLSGAGFDSGYAFIKVTNKDATVNIRRWL